jgi:hypothetical protein
MRRVGGSWLGATLLALILPLGEIRGDDAPAPAPASGVLAPPPEASSPFDPEADQPAEDAAGAPLAPSSEAPPAAAADEGDPAAAPPRLRLFDRSPSELALGFSPPPPRVFLPGRSETVARFGWWTAGSSGSPVKVGQYQSLNSSPFWDVDSVQSDGVQSLDFWGSGLDNDANNVRSRFFRNGFSAEADFQRFLYRQTPTPLSGGPPHGTNQVVVDNLNVGQDYAIRWDQLNIDFKDRLSDHWSWKVKLWGIRKFGERQANSMAHCFNVNFGTGQPADNRCHVVSQKQQIDWLTTEVEPGIEGRFDRLTIDYALTLRQFSQSDQTVFNAYTNFPPFGSSTAEGFFPYALVPDSTFRMNRLKLGYDLTRTLRFYSYFYVGDMVNNSRRTDREFRGFDSRFIHTSPSGVTLTAYAKMYGTSNQYPPFLLPEEQSQNNPTATILHPVDYTRLWAGLDGQLFPFRTASPRWQGLTVRAGYEFRTIVRNYSTFPTNLAPDYVKPPTVTNDIITASSFTQPTTIQHELHVGPWWRLASGVVVFARERVLWTNNPMFGLYPPSGALNTNFPTFDNLLEAGGSWSPLSNLMFSAQVGLQNSWNQTRYSNFSQNNYPVNVTAWYAPTPRWSLSAGYSYFSNWIDQDITFGYRGVDEPPPAETLRVGYNGHTHMTNIGTQYQWNERLTLMGGFIWNNGSNIFTVPPSQTGADWSNLGTYSAVVAETIRYQTGLDYLLTRNVSTYVRFNWFTFNDLSQNRNSGDAYFILAGLSAKF